MNVFYCLFCKIDTKNKTEMNEYGYLKIISGDKVKEKSKKIELF